MMVEIGGFPPQAKTRNASLAPNKHPLNFDTQTLPALQPPPARRAADDPANGIAEDATRLAPSPAVLVVSCLKEDAA